ncbi:MAG TPA: hypothetical protein VFR37_11470 [Longimicrobium sp.]|nr:hypothetical protein [Longimicrobium sp.]
MSRFAPVVVLLCAVMASRAGAQVETPQDSARDTIPARPMVEGGIHDKPFLTRLMGRTAIGGYAEAHARFARADGVTEEAGFLLKRWNIFTSTQVSDFVRIGAELEFEEGGEEIKLEYAAIDVGIHPALTLRAGAILAPLGRFNLSHDSPRNEFTDRPIVSTEIVGTALTEAGVGAFGVVGLGPRGRLTYELYAVNGFDDGLITDSPDGTRIPFGRGNFEDNNASPALTGRVAWSPRVGYELGVSGHHGAYNTFHVDGARIDERNDLTIVALDVEARVAGIEWSGEAVQASIDIPAGLRGIYASGQRGLYLQGMRVFGRGRVWTMPGSYFAVGARLDVVDFDTGLNGDAVQRLTGVLNFRPTEDTVLKLDFQRGRSSDRFNNRGDGAAMLFSIATYF